MTSVPEHYENHLAAVYAWMAGGAEAAFARGRQELADLGLLDEGALYAVDLGAGFGMHAVPLAGAGHRVLAIDSSARLLRELGDHAGTWAITTVHGELLDFSRHLVGKPDLVLCMGDTLTHLPGLSAVTTLIATVARQLRTGGRFVITFRDYSKALEGARRFIPVRSDTSRILTCFLEHAADTVAVHDILHEATAAGWIMRVSAYRKLRLEPGRVEAQLRQHGFTVEVGAGAADMLRFCATRV